MKKKITSVILAVSMLFSCIAVGSFAAQASVTEDNVSAVVDSDSVGADYGLANNVQDGQILQCWNWSYNGIKNNMKKIAEQGFSAVQTSPVQTIKESTQGKTMQGSWWVYYQPSNFNIDTSSQNALGTKAQFKAMCDEAHKYGIKVIVDAVLNHMANKGDNTLSDTIPSDIRNDNNCWHSIYTNTSNWDSRWDITHNCMGGLPDLNTGNSKIQNYEIKFMKECIDCGVDGFRFDGAKHIEVPNDYENAGSNFWTNLLGQTTSYAQSTRGITPYYYGEILDKTGGGQNIVNQYTGFMSVTCNEVSNAIRNSVNSGDSNGAKRSDFCYQDGSQPKGSKAVLWNESHDTYADGSSRNQNDTTLKKTWAIVGSRAEAVGMYMARPSNYNNSIGTASVTAWGDKEVQAVNKFRNAMVGKSEYLSSSGSIVYNERGTDGVVLVNLSGSSTSVNVKANKMTNGTYKDAVTGSTFTVSNGQISGQIGSTGIAVVYNEKPAGPSASVTPGSTTYKTDTLTLTLSYSNATSGQYSIDGSTYQSYTTGKTITIGSGVPYGSTTTVKVKATNGTETSEEKSYTYTKVDPSAVQMLYFDNSSYNWSSVYAYIYIEGAGEVAAWPGKQMTKDSTGYYALEVPEAYAEGLVMFTEGASSQNRYPAEMQPGMPLEGKSKIFVAGNILKDYTSTTPTQPTTQPPTQPTTQPTTSPVVGSVLVGDTTGDNQVSISDATEIQRYVAQMIVLTGNTAIAADVNMDGIITIADATLIQQYLVKITNSGNHCGEWYGNGQNPTQPTTQPQTDPVEDGNYLYYKGSWSNVNAYWWSDSNPTMMTWPGTAMENLGGGVFRIEVPSEAQHIIFNNGNDKTGDLDIPGYGMMYSNGLWSKYSGGGEYNPPTPSGNYVYYKNNNGWGTVNAYMWSEANTNMMTWPGKTMESVGNNVYRVEVKSGATKIIFSDNGNNQTDDLDLQVGKMYDNGSWVNYN